MSSFKSPNPLMLDGNLSENWKKFKRDFDNYLTATEKDDKPDKVKLAILETYIGDAGLQLLDSLHIPDTDAVKYDTVGNQKFGGILYSA